MIDVACAIRNVLVLTGPWCNNQQFVMGLWDSFCGDTTLHGYQYIIYWKVLEKKLSFFNISKRKERRPLWFFVVFLSMGLAVFFLWYNITEYLSRSFIHMHAYIFLLSFIKLFQLHHDQHSVNNKQPGQHLLPLSHRVQHEPDQVWFGNIFVLRMMWLQYCYRDSFWRNIGLEEKTDQRRKKFVKTYFTGSAEPSTEEEDTEMNLILHSPPFQKAFCNYLIHTSMEIAS